MDSHSQDPRPTLTSTPALSGYTSGLHSTHCLCTHTTSLAAAGPGPAAAAACGAAAAPGAPTPPGTLPACWSRPAASASAAAPAAAALLSSSAAGDAPLLMLSPAAPDAVAVSGAVPVAAASARGPPDVCWSLLLPDVACFAGGMQTGMRGPRPRLLRPELLRALAWSMWAPGASGAWHRAQVVPGGGSLCTSACHGHKRGGASGWEIRHRVSAGGHKDSTAIGKQARWCHRLAGQ